MNRAEVDHTPGGSPEGRTADAPSNITPRMTTNPDARRGSAIDPGAFMSGAELFTAKLADYGDGTVTAHTGYAMAAARLSLRGANWSEDDRAECAGWIAAEVTGAAKAARTGTPAEVLRWIDRCERFPILMRRYEDSNSGVPRSYATMTRLTGMAANWRRSELRRRDRDERAQRERAVVEGFTATVESDQEGVDPVEVAALKIGRERATVVRRSALGDASRGVRVTRWIDAVLDADTQTVQRAVSDHHHRSAREALGALGLPRMGKAYVAAYLASAIPSQSSATNDERHAATVEATAALGFTGKAPSAIRMAAKRSRIAIPSAETHTYLDHAEVCGVTLLPDVVAHGLKVSDVDPRTHDRGDDCRCSATDEHPATPLDCAQHPITVRRKIGGKRQAWNGKRTAAWTDQLPASTRARLEASAKYREARRTT